MSDEICICEKDKDGQCPSCLVAIQEAARNLIEVQTEYMERLREVGLPDKCKSCTARYLDHVFALLVGKVFEQHPLKIALPLSQTLVVLLIKRGRPCPLTQKAMEDGCKAAGFEPPPASPNNA